MLRSYKRERQLDPSREACALGKHMEFVAIAAGHKDSL